MTGPHAPAADAGRELSRELARTQLEGLRSRGQALAACLEADPIELGRDRWRGAANGVYRLRLAKVRARLPAALAAIDAAERALRPR